MNMVSFFIKYWRRMDLRFANLFFAFVIILSIVNGLANTALLALVAEALSDVGAASELLWYFLGLCLLVPFTRFLSEVLILNLALKVSMDLQINFFRQVLVAPLHYLEKLGAGRLLAVLNEDVVYISEAITAVMNLFMYGAIIVFCLAYLGWLSLPLMGLAVGIMTAGLIFNQILSRKGWSFLRRAREHSDTLYGHFQALTLGNKELKLHSNRLASFFNNDLGKTTDHVYHNKVTGGAYYIFATNMPQGLYFLMIGAVLFLGPVMNVVSTTTHTTAAMLILFLMTPMVFLLVALRQIGYGQVSVDKIEKLGLTLIEETREREHFEQPVPDLTWQSLEIRDVAFTYFQEGVAHPFRVGPLNMTFEPGEIVFIQGPNGSGKTTIAKLLLGLYTPESGQIVLDGEVVHDDNRDNYRQHFSAIFPDFEIFDSLLGLEGNDVDKRAQEYLTRLRIDHKVKVEDSRFSTTNLSQGQRKRLALLTSYLEDRPIYLFDEWAADQEPQFRDFFYEEILPDLKRRGKTVLAITHDTQYGHVADRTIRLDFGTVEFDRRRESAA